MKDTIFCFRSIHAKNTHLVVGPCIMAMNLIIDKYVTTPPWCREKVMVYYYYYYYYKLDSTTIRSLCVALMLWLRFPANCSKRQHQKRRTCDGTGTV